MMKGKWILAVLLVLALLPFSALADNGALLDYYDAYCGGMPFRAWPIELQYSFAQALPELLTRFQATTDASETIAQIAQHRYGLPGESDLSQVQATLAALKFLCRDDANDENALAACAWTYSFLIDDPEHPEWLIGIYQDGWSGLVYQLRVPARGGEISAVYDADAHVATPDEILQELADSLGDREKWSYLDKARYSQKIEELMTQYPGFNDDHAYIIYGLPEDGEVSYEQAVTFAQNSLDEAYGANGDWNAEKYANIQAEFVRVSYLGDDRPTPFWSIVLWNESYDQFYQVILSAGLDGSSLLNIYTPSSTNG